MRIQHKRTGLPSLWSLVLLAVLAACGSDSSDGQTVAVNLSLIVEGRQAQDRSVASRLFAWIERWLPGATPAWAQTAVSDITGIQVQITGPGITTPATAEVPVSDPTSGQNIPVSIQAPVGTNRTITVAARNAAGEKTFGGTLSNVTLAPGPPIALAITLKPVFTIILNKAGGGSGTVTSTQPGINCDPSCSTQSAEFDGDIAVALNAAASPGSTFAGWSGDCTGTGACIFDRGTTGNVTVTALFVPAVTSSQLTVIKAGTGIGTVTSNPSGIICGTACTANFQTGSVVTLTAFPAAGSTFTGWSGGGCGGAIPTCVVVMNGPQTVTATFTGPIVVPMSTLTVQKSGSGSGTVTSAPSGINCGNTCSTQFPTTNTVTLTADPAQGSTFVGWSGACSGLSCSVTMETDKTVSAQFDVLPVFVTLTVRKSGSGLGTVTSADGLIVCDPGCQTTQATYLQGTQVTLTATPALGSIFVEWMGGPCNNQTGPCVLLMDRDRTAEANFDPIGGGGGPGG
jgi:uncharacterized repeat protein (TIGR02543 family)